MAILVDARSRILIQGITGETGRAYAARMVAAGTPLVGGTSPGKAGQAVEGVPVFATIAEAVAATGADCVLSSVRPAAALAAMTEVFEAGIRVAVLYTENVPVHDAMRMRALARARGACLLGPNSAGVISPGRANLADLNDARVRAGRIGVVSKSGTLTYEVIDGLHAEGLGESTVVCLGGDPVVGTGFAEILRLFEADPGTDAVVLVGEPGGAMEHEAAAVVRTMRKPVVAYVTGQRAPPAKRMGHAGAVSGAGAEATTAAAKLAALRSAGCTGVDIVTDVGAAMVAALAARRGAHAS
ncbi:MAG: succinate--CoA ligase subunit alpha [Alphaproteobacteria bacterium]|nr:succinate--CoA ligase subunit alpha [Alphaproteobacteria bacterium]